MRTIRTVGLVVALLGLVPFVVSMVVPVNGSSTYWSVASLFIATGVVINIGTLVWEHLPNKLESKKEIVVNTNTKTIVEEVEPSPSELQEKDLKALYYLSERCNNMKDKLAVALCRELQDRFFCLHHSLDPNEDVNDEKTNTSPSSNPST